MKVPRWRPWTFRTAISEAHRGNVGPLCALLEDEGKPLYGVDRRELAKLIRRAVPSSWKETKIQPDVPDTLANAVARIREMVEPDLEALRMRGGDGVRRRVPPGERKRLLLRAKELLILDDHPEAANVDIDALNDAMGHGD